MTLHPPRRLSLQLALALVLSIAAVAVVGGIGLVSLRRLSTVTQQALHDQIALLNNASAFETLLYQKGFVAEYMLTRDGKWLEHLARSRTDFTDLLSRARAQTASPEAQRLLTQIADEYTEYDGARVRIITLFESNQRDAALALLDRNHGHIAHLLFLCKEVGNLGRQQAERTLAASQRSMHRRTWMLMGASLAAALASLMLGFLLARRIDAALDEQRRRLIQSEKMSAMGELSAKLAHEILNPLSGMKAAVQLILRGDGEAEDQQVKETAGALEREILRIEQLVRRLVHYARPLSPRIERHPAAELVDAAVDAAQAELVRARVEFSRRDDPNLPVLEVDSLLLTQALLNILSNAAQASPPGGKVVLSTRKVIHLGREHLCFEVADEGPGIPREHMARLFQPFFTTKPEGHGLGLALSHNIVMEHGGQILARNSDRGAVFAILLPLAR